MATVRLIIRRQTSDPNSGFRVTLDARDFNHDDMEGTLPPLPPSLEEALAAWRSAYGAQEEVRSHCRIAPGAVTRQSIRDINELAEALEQNFNAWLRSTDRGWVRIRELLVRIAPQDPQLLLDCGNHPDLKRLPWQEWELFTQYYHRADPALRMVNDSRQPLPDYPPPRSTKVRILVVVGDSTGINATQDLACVTRLQSKNPKRVEVVSLWQPTPTDLQQALEQSPGFHIFIYVGHSRSREDSQVGWLLLNSQDELSIRDFRLVMRQAIQRGLQLVILNSCDGLGLAQQLANLDLPRCVVMKEPVPDEVAVEFIDRFFRAFVEEHQLLQGAVRQARHGLESFNSRYSEVTWLPTVCIKQNTPPLTWQALLNSCNPKKAPWLSRRLAAGAVAGLAVLGGVVWTIRPIIVSLQEHLIQPRLSVPPEQLISAGDNPNLEGSPQLSGDYAQLKQQGLQAFIKGDYVLARDTFDQIRIQAKAQYANFAHDRQSSEFQAALAALQDPTVLIYRNNAEARRRHTTGKPIYTIAAAVPLTTSSGTPFDVGRQMLYGIAQAQDQYQDRGLEVVIANDHNDPQQAAAVAQAITQFEQDGRKVLAVVGHYISASTCEALKQQYNEAHLVVVSPLSTVADIRRSCGPSIWFFRTTSSTRIETRTLVNHLVKRGLNGPNPSVAIFYRKGEFYSDDLYKEFQLALDGEGIPIAQSFNLDAPSFNATQALNSVAAVNALVVIPDGRNTNSQAFDRALEVIRANAGRKMVLGSNPLYNQKIVEPAGGLSNLQNILFIATDWHPKCADTNFVKETEKKYWFGGVNRTTVLSYEAIQALLPALREGVTSEQIRQQLNNRDVNGSAPRSRVFGKAKTISFDDNGDRKEIQERLLATVGNDFNNPFVVVGDCP